MVFAASSLREPFLELAQGFEDTHPGARVRMQFAGSQLLRVQLEHGARADVFASADQRHMEALQSRGMVEAPELFARNALVVVVAGHAAGVVTDFHALPRAGRIVLGHPEAPIGRYTATLLENAGAAFAARVREHLVSEELNVGQVLHKVVLGEADAGIVYRSDLLSAGAGVNALEIPSGVAPIAEYPIAVTREAREPELARAWVAWVRSETGVRVLERAGFLMMPEAVAQP